MIWVDVLTTLYYVPSLNLEQLARFLGISEDTCRNAVFALIDKGFLVHHPTICTYVLTPEGRTTLKIFL